MKTLANLLSGAAKSTTSSTHTPWFVYDEPECPEELI